MQNYNFVSIIIPSLNEEKHIGMCLASIRNLDLSKEFYEVILSDNGSVDKTLEIVETFKESINLRILVTPGVKVAELRNIGVNASRGDVLAFLDADCTVHKDWLNNAIQHFSDQSIAAVGYGHEIPPECSWIERAWDLNKKRKLGPAKTLPSGNMIVRRTSFLAVGGFDSSLITNEDFDLCYRLRGKGFKLFSDPEIKAVHWGFPQNLASFYKREKWHGTHVFKVFFSNIGELKNLKAVSFALYYIFAIFFLIISLIVYLVNGDSLYITISAFALFFPPLLLSLKTLQGRKISSPKYFIQLFILYLIYGVARARSVLQYK